MSDDATKIGSEEGSGNPDGAIPALSAENAEFVKTKGFDNNPNTVFDSFRELEQKVGQSIIPPGEDASEEDVSAFYGKLGRPDEASGYEFALPEGLGEDFPYDQGLADKYKDWSHKAGLTPTQAQSIHNSLVADINEQLDQQKAAHTESVRASHDDLVKEWGQADSDEYKTNLRLVDRVIAENSLMEDLRTSGIIGPNNEVLKPGVVKFLAKVGDQLYKEDGLTPATTLSESVANPWREDDPKQFSLTEQGRIYRESPDLARKMIAAAGLDPARYNL